MAKFGNLVDEPALKQIDESEMHGFKQVEVSDFELEGVSKDAFNFENEFAKMAQEAQEEQNQTDNKTDFVLDAFGDLGKTMQEAAISLSEEAILLQEAIGLIKQEEFERALEKLNRLLELPNHTHEAYYLKAVCECSVDAQLHDMNTELRALCALYPLHGVNLDSDLAPRVDILRDKIRQVLRVKLPIILTLEIEKPDAVLTELLKLDPKFELLYVIFISHFMSKQRVMDAYNLSLQGLQNLTSKSAKERLSGLKRRIEQELFKEVLMPAIELFKDDQYKNAKKELTNVSLEFRDSAMFRLLETYLAKLCGKFFGLVGKADPSCLAQLGSSEDVQALQSLIVSKETALAMHCIRNEAYREAINVSKVALNYAPALPFPNFLLAAAIFKDLASGGVSDIDGDVRRLQTAYEHAQIGERDPEISDAKALVAAIAGQLGKLRQLQAHIQRMKEEAARVNSCIQEFHDIMGSAEGGIESIEQFKSIHSRMHDLNNAIPAVKAKTDQEQGREALDALHEAVKRNLESLEEINADIKQQEAESALVNGPAESLSELLDDMKGNIGSLEDVDHYEQRLMRIKGDIKKNKRNLQSMASQSAIDDISEAADKYLEQLSGIRAEIKQQEAESKYLDEPHETFKSIMNDVEGGIDSKDDITKFEHRFKKLRELIGRNKWKVESKQAKEVLQNLEKAVDRNLKQLRELGSQMMSSKEDKIVKGHADRFNTVMKALNSGNTKFESRQQLTDFIGLIESNISEVKRDKRNVSSSQAEDVLEQILDGWERLLGQLSSL